MTYTMWHKDYNEFVTVFEIKDGFAFYYSPSMEKKTKNGWCRGKVSRLIPEEYYYKSVRLSTVDSETSSLINNIADAVINVKAGD